MTEWIVDVDELPRKTRDSLVYSVTKTGEPEELVRCRECARAVGMEELPPRCLLFGRLFPEGFFCAWGVRR